MKNEQNKPAPQQPTPEVLPSIPNERPLTNRDFGYGRIDECSQPEPSQKASDATNGTGPREEG